MQGTAKVGLLLAVFVGLLIGGYAVLGKSLFAPKPDVYYADLDDAGGIAEGTKVLMAGVAVGTVSEVKLLSPKQARMKLELTRGIQIPQGSTVQLPTALISFGESPISIIPPVTTTAVMVAPGGTLASSKSSPLDGILPGAKNTMAELNRTMIAVRKLLEDQKLHGQVTDLLASSNKTIERFGVLANNASTLLAANQGNIARSLRAATQAVEDVHTVTMKVAEMVRDGKLQKNAVAIMDRVKKISEHADELVGSMNKLINDPKLRGPITETAANVASITTTGKEIASNTAAMTKNGIAITENAAIVSKKAITLTEQATAVATKATQIEDQLKGVLDKVGGFFSKAPNAKDFPKVTTELDLMRQTQPGYWRTDLTLSVPLQDSTLNLGIYDAFEKDKLTIQLGKPVTDRFSYRYGIYASTPALGVDYRLAPRLSLRGDAWDINAPRLDLRASYEFGNGLIGWLGVDRFLRDNALTIGVGIRR